MMLVTAIIKPFRLKEVLAMLEQQGMVGATVSDVRGYGRTRGHVEVYRGAEYTIEFVPKVKLELLVENEDARDMIELISATARTGDIGDGKVWSTPVYDVVRVRTGEQGVAAI